MGTVNLEMLVDKVNVLVDSQCISEINGDIASLSCR